MSNAAASKNVSGASSSPSRPESAADLVLLSADPLADIHNTTQIQSVWLRGKYFDLAALDQLLANSKHRHGNGRLGLSRAGVEMLL